MLLNEEFYTRAINIFKFEFYRRFSDKIVLEETNHSHLDRGYFKLVYKHLPTDYNVIIENDMLWFSVQIKDKDGAKTLLYRIEEYDDKLEEINISKVVHLLEKVLDKNKFYMYLRQGGKIYRKLNNQLEEIEGYNEVI